MSLLTIPPEIWATIDSHLDDDDRRHLCECCHALMNTLQAKAYRSIRLDESPESGSAVLALAFGPRATFVRRIEYSPLDNDGWEVEDDSDSEQENDKTLSDETRQALESLHQFAGLEEFCLVLDPPESVLQDLPETSYSLASPGSTEGDPGHDEEKPWRVLLEGSLLALTKSAGAFSKLEISNLPPIPTEQPYMALETSGWQTLLRELTSLEITLPEYGDDGAGNLTISHQSFLNQFPRIFLAHLPNVERLRLVGKEDGFIGHYDAETPIDWEPLSMPRLKTCELEYSYLDTSLVSFLLNHSSTLERIYLKHCLGCSKSNWQNVLRGFVESDATHLVEFRIVAYPVPKRSFYPGDEEWREAWERMLKEMVKAHLNAKGLVPFVRDDFEADEVTQADNDPDPLKPWDTVVVDERRRRFVVGETCESYGQLQPAELYGDPEDSDLDEADVVGSWEEVEKLMERNMAKAGSVN